MRINSALFYLKLCMYFGKSILMPAYASPTRPAILSETKHCLIFGCCPDRWQPGVRKYFWGFLQVGGKNEPRQIQDAGVHCVHPDLPQNNYDESVKSPNFKNCC